jgi:hypothetical protein
METKLQIIHTDDYILAVSDKHHIDKNGLYYDTFDKSIKISDCYQQSFRINEIIAYKSKNNAPELDLPLLPEIVVEDGVRKLALTLYKEPLNKEGEVRTQLVGHGSTPFGFNKWFKAFKKGYKAATKVYSEEDLIDFATFRNGGNVNEEFQLWKSLKQPKWFVAETVCDQCLDDETVDSCYCNFGNYKTVLKTTTINNKTYLEGTYLN